MGVGAARQPPLQTQRLQLVWRGISHFKQRLFRRLPAPCRRLFCPGEVACSGREAVRSERPAAAGLPLVSGARLSPHYPLRPAPREEMHWNVRGGWGQERAAKADSGRSLPRLSGSPAPGSGTEYVPFSRPRESSGPQPFPSAISQMVKRGGVPAGRGRGVCVWRGGPPVPGGGAWGVT